ncbi:maleylpyruvate isomerase family mycothiol-dependent enzyme [Streptomyces sp. t39]|uniref:maleylpyruvate isomerase family mycothiol-dependent enzyme n=1 Tax=Streptomyces sp. t39 TaxID=1828156 RepID=UPI0011CE65F4|nr:maleylpyruvate isomerase family mycothiol-dependent enzyme [Streptomyces sp. t39]TXS51588.1 maleylpyruvate isomerase family mycothiol-dependent enzyme [Streptomyces sp. t39]
MSDALLNTLAEALAEVVATIDTCDDETLDPDTAVTWLESTGALLDRLSPADRQSLGRLLRRAADRHPAGPWRDELQRLPESFGLDDDQHELYCAAIEHLVRRFTAVVGDVDPATPVTTCPGWTFADLVRHLGTTHRWAAHVVQVRASEPVWARDVPLGLPEDPAALPNWTAEAADLSLAVLRKVDPDTPVWSYGADQRVAGYARRLLFEAVVHLADAELSLGQEPDIAAGTAADGIEEFLENLPHLARLAGPVAALPAGTVRLTARDTGAAWTLSFGPGGFSWTRTGQPVCPAPSSAAVSGTAADLLLFVHGRRGPEDRRLTVTGDPAVLTGWLTATAF